MRFAPPTALCDSAAMRTPNFFAETGLDRMSERRADADWLRALRDSADAVILPVWKTHNLVAQVEETSRAVMLAVREVRGAIAEDTHFVFLGYRGGVPHFAVDLSHHEEPLALPPLAGRGEFRDIRDVGLDMPRDEGALLAYSRALFHWHRTHGFCGRCGAPTESRDAGHVRVCTGTGCGAQHFPRTDMAVIMLVSRGDYALLGRKAEWPEGRFSVLAGFVEPGESLEGAVAREVMEEAGIAVRDVRYHSSQPWPFPANLMLGFFARTDTEELRLNDRELAEARWFHRDELIGEARAYAQRPHAVSIARRLMADWALGNEP